MLLDDLKEVPGYKSIGEDGGTYTWDAGELWRLLPGPFNDGATLMLPSDILWEYEPVPVNQAPEFFLLGLE